MYTKQIDDLSVDVLSKLYCTVLYCTSMYKYKILVIFT